MNDHYYTDLEEGEIRELVAPYTPVSNCQKSQSPSRASTTMSSADCGSSSSTSRTTGTTRHFRGNNDSGYYYDSDDDSIRSSRPCTPPGLCISKGTVPHAPEPVFRTMSSFPGLTRTNLESPTPQPTSSPRFRRLHSEPEFGTSSEIRDDSKRSREENLEPPVVCPAETWEIAPDVYEKVQSALARVLAMDQAGAGREWDCQQPAGSQPAQKCSVGQVEEYGCHHDHKAPKSPLSPEELERAIGIIEELSVVNGVPPDVFVQSGISPGTLYHAFKHLGHTLERYFEGSLPKSPAPSFSRK